MGALMWVEVLDRHGDVAARYRFDDIARWPVRVGRAPDNDIVLDDPHVAPHHAVIGMDRDGHLYAEDQDSINGLVNDRTRQREARIDFSRNPMMRLGKTRIRVRDGREDVAAEKPLASDSRAGAAALVLTLVLFGLSMLDLWMGFTGDAASTHFVLPVMMVALLVLLWTSAWALVSRIFAGQTLYTRHLVVALAVAVGGVIFNELREWLSYAMALPVLEEKDIVSFWLMLAIACYWHLRVMAVRAMRLAMTLVTIALAAVVGLQWVTMHETRKWTGQQATLGTLKPPAFRLARPVAADDFLSRTNGIKDELDAVRKKEPGQSGFGRDSDDDN